MEYVGAIIPYAVEVISAQSTNSTADARSANEQRQALEQLRRYVANPVPRLHELLEMPIKALFVAAGRDSATPTTWFVDPAGRIAFTKVGMSTRLEEEFAWRIEACSAANK